MCVGESHPSVGLAYSYAFRNPLHRINTIADMQFVKRFALVSVPAILGCIVLRIEGCLKFVFEVCEHLALAVRYIVNSEGYDWGWGLVVHGFEVWFVKQRYNAPTYFVSPRVKKNLHHPFYCDLWRFSYICRNLTHARIPLPSTCQSPDQRP